MIISLAFVVFPIKGLKISEVIFSSFGKDPFEWSVRSMFLWLLHRVM